MLVGLIGWVDDQRPDDWQPYGRCGECRIGGDPAPRLPRRLRTDEGPIQPRAPPLRRGISRPEPSHDICARDDDGRRAGRPGPIPPRDRGARGGRPRRDVVDRHPLGCAPFSAPSEGVPGQPFYSRSARCPSGAWRHGGRGAHPCGSTCDHTGARGPPIGGQGRPGVRAARRHPGQRLRRGRRGRLLPRVRPAQGGDGGPELCHGDEPACADDAARRPRSGRARRAPVEARGVEQADPGPARHRDGAVGHQGLGRHLEGRLLAGHDGPRDREAGGGGAGAAFARHHGGRRVPGRGEDAGGRDVVRIRAVGDAAAGAADPDGDRAGEEHDRRHEHDRGGGHHRRGRFPDGRVRKEGRQERVTPGRARPAVVLLAIVLSSVILVALAPTARAQGPRVLVATVDGAIDRSTVEYFSEALDEARTGGYAALVVRFDTPGGELASTLALTELMDNARTVPILGWVGPVGAHAFSAGTILLESTDLAAMATGTTIGSVQPVIVGPTGIEPVTDPKIVNAVVGILETQMALNGRNKTVTIGNQTMTLAEWFVVENLNLNAADAQRYGASNFTADSIEDFLTQADGTTTIYKGVQMHVAGAEIVPFSASARVRLLELLSDPLVASLLLILGIYLVIFEVNTPGHGAFGIGGIVAIILAAAFLAPLRPPRFVVSPDYQIFFLAALLTPTGFFGGFLLFAVYKVQQVRRQKPRVGEMIGEGATVVDGLRAGERGYVRTRGELWQALSDQDQPADAKVYIHEIEGITLHVSASPPPPPAPPPLRQRFALLMRRKPA